MKKSCPSFIRIIMYMCTYTYTCTCTVYIHVQKFFINCACTL